MATQQQIEANRLNAQKSTGPKSEEGRRASSQNALKSGLDAESQFVLGESREEFAELQAEHINHYQPTTPEERFQVDTLIRNEWILRRLFRVEAHLWEYHAMQADPANGVQLGEAFAKASPVFMRLQRRITAAEKAHKEAKAELDRLKKAAEPQETKAETPQLGSFLTDDMSDFEIERRIAEMNLFFSQQAKNPPAPDPGPAGR